MYVYTSIIQCSKGKNYLSSSFELYGNTVQMHANATRCQLAVKRWKATMTI